MLDYFITRQFLRHPYSMGSTVRFMLSGDDQTDYLQEKWGALFERRCDYAREYVRRQGSLDLIAILEDQSCGICLGNSHRLIEAIYNLMRLDGIVCDDYY
jgi:hypothetical protein